MVVSIGHNVPPPEAPVSPNQARINKAIDAFSKAGFKAGDDIPHAWFFGQAGLQQPTDDTPFKEAKSVQLKMTAFMAALVPALLIERKIALRSKFGFGYSVVPPGQQAGWARDELNDELKSSFKKAETRAGYVDTDKLTPAEKAEATNVMADLGIMRVHIDADRAAAKRRDRMFKSG